MEGCWVFGRVERLEPNLDNPFLQQEFDGDKCLMGETFAVIVEKRDAQTLIPVLCRFVRPGYIIILDCWKAYDRIKEVKEVRFYYYEHQTVNHSETFKNSINGAHTNTCEGSWSLQYKLHILKQAYNLRAFQGHLMERVWKRKYKDALWDNLLGVMAGVRSDLKLTSCSVSSQIV